MVEEPSAARTCSRGVTGDTRESSSSVSMFEETLGVLLQRPMGLKPEEKHDI